MLADGMFLLRSMTRPDLTHLRHAGEEGTDHEEYPRNPLPVIGERRRWQINPNPSDGRNGSLS